MIGFIKLHDPTDNSRQSKKILTSNGVPVHVVDQIDIAKNEYRKPSLV